MSKIDEKRIVSVTSPGMKRVRMVIAESPVPIDGHTIAKRAHVSFLTWANTYRHLLIRAGLVHVAGWRHNTRGPFVPLFGSGPGTQAERPEKIDSRARARDWKDRTGYNEARKAERRLRKPPDFALAALMGLTARYHKDTTTPASPAERNAA